MAVLASGRYDAKLSSRLLEIAQRKERDHVLVQGAFGTGKSSAAARRIAWLARQEGRRVLALSGRSTEQCAMKRYVDSVTAFNELERQGHCVCGLREWSHGVLEELGHGRRILSFARLTPLLVHHIAEVPLRQFHHRLATQSSVHLRRQVEAMVRFFTLLEANGVTPDKYDAYCVEHGNSIGEEEREQAAAYRSYRELLDRHDVTSWDGEILDMLEYLKKDPQDLRTLTDEFSDIVVDDADRMTPAMTELVAQLLRAPSIQSSTTFSEQGQDTQSGERIKQLESILQDSKGSEESKLISVHSSGDSNMPTNGPASVPVVCKAFMTADDEFEWVAKYAKDKQKQVGASGIAVLCATHADVEQVSKTLMEHDLSVCGFTGHVHSSTMRHILDEPDVLAVYSMLAALCFPSNTLHIYNILRSGLFGLDPDMLSLIMESYQRQANHWSLADMLQSFVDTKGSLLPPDSCTPQALLAAIASVQSFLDVWHDCKRECHKKTVQDIVHDFLVEAGALDRLLNPTSPSEESGSIALAAFLREVERAARIVDSDFVPFVVPYLLQLRTSRVSIDTEATANENDDGITVLPLTRASLDELEAKSIKVMMLVGMRDSKFPGRMQRVTWPLPTSILSEPLPIQKRSEFTQSCERIVHDALAKLRPAEITLSFAKGGYTSSMIANRSDDKLSRVLQSLWVGPQDINMKENEASQALSPLDDYYALRRSSYKPDHLSYSQIVEYLQCPYQYYLARVLRLQDKADVGGGSIPLMFGHAVHQAFAAFARELQAGRSRSYASTIAREELGRAWRHAGFISREQEDFFVERAQKTLETFMNHADDANGVIERVEHPFACKMPPSGTELRGVWDRIDRTPDGIVIREFKTRPSGAKVATDNDVADNLQLQIYMVAYEMVYGERPYEATLEVVGEDAMHVDRVPFDPSIRDHVHSVVDQTVQAIDHGEFQPAPSFMRCSTCPYRGSVCQAGTVSSDKAA